MSGSLNDILPEPISEANEKVIMDLLKRKMTVSIEIAVQLLHAMEARFGPEVREVVREMAASQEFEQNPEEGDPQSDLQEFCTMIDHAAAGSHRWDRVVDELDCVGYHFTRCLYAEAFRELGEPDLGWVMCSRDGPWVKSYNSKLAFKRTKTLMQGDAMCDHVFYVEKA
jgi:hypothetical protein